MLLSPQVMTCRRQRGIQTGAIVLSEPVGRKVDHLSLYSCAPSWPPWQALATLLGPSPHPLLTPIPVLCFSVQTPR